MKEDNALYLIWEHPLNKQEYIVGKLTRKNGYTFKYCGDYKKAREVGWEPIMAFPEFKEYHSNTLFSAFSSRLPDRRRKNIDAILRKYGCSEYDGFDLLKNSGGRLPIDTYKFTENVYEEKLDN